MSEERAVEIGLKQEIERLKLENKNLRRVLKGERPITKPGSVFYYSSKSEDEIMRLKLWIGKALKFTEKGDVVEMMLLKALEQEVKD